MIRQFIKRQSNKIGLAPGTLVHIGEEREADVHITVMDYDATQINETTAQSVKECMAYKDSDTVTWINVSGIHDTDIIKEFGKTFDIHPLVLEDIVHTGQRPKVEEFPDYLFVILKMLYVDDDQKSFIAEQVSLIVGAHFVISFQEREEDVFEPVRERIRNVKLRIRKLGTDYLAYALIDTIVDHYFVVLENQGEQLEALENTVLYNPTPDALKDIHHIKQDMIMLRKSVWPLREVVSNLTRLETALIKENTLVYIRDVYDHTIQVMDTIESFRDVASGLLDTYLSTISNRMNSVMQTLTVIASIFIPLTFIAGIYGMNFQYMPELAWHHGYFVALGVMVLVAIVMLLFFKRKHWL